jgi:predicted dienelactone hydrolase
VIVGTDEFQELARLESRNRGLPGLPLVLVPHPLGGIGEAEVLAKAEAAAPLVVQALDAGGTTAAGAAGEAS